VAAQKLGGELSTISAPHSMGRTSAAEAECCRSPAAAYAHERWQPASQCPLPSSLGLAQRLGVDGASFAVDQLAQAVEVVRVNEFNGNAQPGKGVVEEVVGSAIKRSGGDNLFSRRCQRGQGSTFRLPALKP